MVKTLAVVVLLLLLMLSIKSLKIPNLNTKTFPVHFYFSFLVKLVFLLLYFFIYIFFRFCRIQSLKQLAAFKVRYLLKQIYILKLNNEIKKQQNCIEHERFCGCRKKTREINLFLHYVICCGSQLRFISFRCCCSLLKTKVARLIGNFV